MNNVQFILLVIFERLEQKQREKMGVSLSIYEQEQREWSWTTYVYMKHTFFNKTLIL